MRKQTKDKLRLSFLLIYWLLLVINMSEFRQDYLRKGTIPSHPLATHALTSQDTAIFSEGDGDTIVRNERKTFSSSCFNSLPFNVIGS